MKRIFTSSTRIDTTLRMLILNCYMTAVASRGCTRKPCCRKESARCRCHFDAV